MSDVIDWSKAPEGATHYVQESGHWYMVAVDAAKYWNPWTSMWANSELWEKRVMNAIPRPQPTPWSCEGLPPVGEVCEMQDDKSEWVKVTIIANHAGFAHGWDSVHECAYFSPHLCEFRPIRTTEQIAADEREAAILEMEKICRSGDFGGGGLAALYDAGYRKQ